MRESSIKTCKSFIFRKHVGYRSRSVSTFWKWNFHKGKRKQQMDDFSTCSDIVFLLKSVSVLNLHHKLVNTHQGMVLFSTAAVFGELLLNWNVFRIFRRHFRLQQLHKTSIMNGHKIFLPIRIIKISLIK